MRRHNAIWLPLRDNARNTTMEKQMGDLSHDSIDIPPRRSFFGRIAAVAALSFSGLTPTLVRAQAAAPASDGPDWPGVLTGRHKQLTDAYEINNGAALGFTHNFLTPNTSATAVIIFRARALPLAIGSAIWAKYKIGEEFKIIDPETKAPAVKNPYFQPKPGVLNSDDIAIDRLLAKGTVMGACNMALHAQSKRLAGNAGVSAEEAAKEWAANVIPGITIIPSGTWGVNRAQEAGCTYCAGG
jgi:hypothetical protein